MIDARTSYSTPLQVANGLTARTAQSLRGRGRETESPAALWLRPAAALATSRLSIFEKSDAGMIDVG